MALETVAHIDDLDAANPVIADPRSEGDDHIRNIKLALLTDFPNIDDVCNPTPAELNFLVGVSSLIQDQLDAKAAISDLPIPAGTIMLFFQANAPDGWTQIAANNDKAIRVVSGTGGGTGGSVAFETAFASKTVAGTNAGTAISIAQMPAHAHDIMTNIIGGVIAAGPFVGGGSTDTTAIQETGGDETHTHTFTGTPIDLDVAYINVIYCSKD